METWLDAQEGDEPSQSDPESNGGRRKENEAAQGELMDDAKQGKRITILAASTSVSDTRLAADVGGDTRRQRGRRRGVHVNVGG